MASNETTSTPILVDRFARLKALQRPSVSPKDNSGLVVAVNPLGEVSEDAQATTGQSRLAEVLGATAKSNCHGEHLSLQCWHDGYPLPTPHPTAMRLLAPNAPDDISDPQRWLFLDTETTGLSGGTGTYAFLVGLAWWTSGGLQIEQLFMREYSEERSLLASLADRLRERPVLVTFNGKSFDWPLLETRYRMTRKIPAPTLQAHLDFVHPARNLWRLRLGSVKLSQLERHVLGWDRGEDVASEQIPRIYHDFVREGHAEPLIPVFLHNQMDLRGLAGLSERILSLLKDEGESSEDGLELYGLSCLCERRGEKGRARKLFQRSIGLDLPSEAGRVARARLARLAKRDGDLNNAREHWESVLGNSREGYEAYEQLAIYWEHHAREPGRALEITREALAQLRRARQAKLISEASYRCTRSKFDHRLNRLVRKQGEIPLSLFRG